MGWKQKPCNIKLETTIMISEKTFARGYSSFWTQNTPWLSDYISFLNKGSVDRIFKPLESLDEPKHRSINNSAAFIDFKQKIIGEELEMSKIIGIASESLKHLPRNELNTYELNKIHSSIILEQSKRLINTYSSKTLTFAPQFKGCGIIANCQGDLYFDDVLCEIKAGERNIHSSDIKQLLVYCALNWLSEEKINIKNIEIFNPRQGIYWNSSLIKLMDNISALPMENLFEEIGHFVYTASEEIEI